MCASFRGYLLLQVMRWLDCAFTALNYSFSSHTKLKCSLYIYVLESHVVECSTESFMHAEFRGYFLYISVQTLFYKRFLFIYQNKTTPEDRNWGWGAQGYLCPSLFFSHSPNVFSACRLLHSPAVFVLMSTEKSLRNSSVNKCRNITSEFWVYILKWNSYNSDLFWNHKW